jgi:hypothetical protein
LSVCLTDKLVEYVQLGRVSLKLRGYVRCFVPGSGRLHALLREKTN